MNHDKISPFHFDALQDGGARLNAAPVEDEAIIAPTVDELREQARAEAMEQGHAEGWAAGHAEGLALGHNSGFAAGQVEGTAQGLDEGRAEGAAELVVIRAVAQQLDGWDVAAAEMLEQTALAIGLELARYIIRAETLTADPNRLAKQVRALIQGLGLAKAPLQLVMHPADAQLLQSTGGWRGPVEEDASMARGGVRLRMSGKEDATPLPDLLQYTEWDGRVETLWSEAVAKLLGESE